MIKLNIKESLNNLEKSAIVDVELNVWYNVFLDNVEYNVWGNLQYNVRDNVWRFVRKNVRDNVYDNVRANVNKHLTKHTELK